MGDVTTRAGSRAAAPSAATSAGRGATARRLWPFVAMVLATLLWWPAAFSGRADWMHLPFGQGEGGVGPHSGDAVLLGSLVAAALVSALVSSPWPRFGIAAGLTALAWVLSEGDVTFAPGERPVLAALAGVGLLLGLGMGARAARGAVGVATFLALVAGLAPATWPRTALLAIALALPFWAATRDRVAPTVLAVVRVVLTWLVAVLVALGLRAGFAALAPVGLAQPGPAARTVASAFVDFVRTRGTDVAQSAVSTYQGGFWVAVALAVAVVIACRAVVSRRG